MVLILVTPGQVVVIENVTRRGAVFESSILRFFSTMDLLFFLFCFVFLHFLLGAWDLVSASFHRQELTPGSLQGCYSSFASLPSRAEGLINPVQFSRALDLFVPSVSEFVPL